MYIKRNLG